MILYKIILKKKEQKINKHQQRENTLHCNTLIKIVTLKISKTLIKY